MYYYVNMYHNHRMCCIDDGEIHEHRDDAVLELAWNLEPPDHDYKYLHTIYVHSSGADIIDLTAEAEEYNREQQEEERRAEEYENQVRSDYIVGRIV